MPKPHLYNCEIFSVMEEIVSIVSGSVETNGKRGEKDTWDRNKKILGKGHVEGSYVWQGK